ncbi:MAG: hypothetical protein R3F07_06485 [Opitutaceae bacterium]
MRIRRVIFVLAGMAAVLFLSGCETGNVAMSVGFSQMGPNGGYYGGSYGTHGSSISIGKVWH